MKKKIVFRADGNSQIGLGHVYRLLALAGMLKNDFECSFAIDQPDAFIKEQIQQAGVTLIALSTGRSYHLPDENKQDEELPFDLAPYINSNTVVVTDGYLFGERYQQAVKQTGAALVCVDDLAQIAFYADIVINIAPGLDHSVYRKQPYTQVYSGLDYAILRQPFFRAIPAPKQGKEIFISLGGSDYFQLTKRAVSLLLSCQYFDVLHILCSSSFSQELLQDLKELGNNNPDIQLHFNLNADELVAVMDRCSYAFTAASTVLIESYARGLQCMTGYYTQNQLFLYNGFIKENKALGLGDLRLLDEAILRQKLKELDRVSVNTAALSSIQNIRSVFKKLSESRGAHIRRANAGDLQLLFEWANDDEVRGNAINTQKIEFDNHVQWFNKRVNSPYSHIFILEEDHQPVAQVRFDFNEATASWDIDYSVAREQRGKGWGKVVLKEAINAFNQFPLTAYVKPSNQRSANVFMAIGFIENGLTDLHGTTLLKYTKMNI